MIMIIYKVVNLINNKIYVGKDSKNNPNYFGSGLLIDSAIKKYGKNNFKKVILEKCSSIEELDSKEKLWINKLHSNDRKIGYNITSGGEGGDVLTNHPKRKQIIEKMSLHGGNRRGAHFSQESKNRLSKSKKGTHWGHHTEKTKKLLSELKVGILFSEEHKKHLSENHRGMLGKHLSEEAKKKIGEKNSLKIRTEEQKRNLSLKMMGRKHSQEVKNIISEKSKEMWAKRSSKKTKEISKRIINTRILNDTLKLSDEAKQKISISKSKTYILLDENGVSISILGICKFCKDNNLHMQSLYRNSRANKFYKGWRIKI